MNVRLALVLVSLCPFFALAASPQPDAPAPTGKTAKKPEGKAVKKKARPEKKAVPQ